MRKFCSAFVELYKNDLVDCLLLISAATNFPLWTSYGWGQQVVWWNQAWDAPCLQTEGELWVGSGRWRGWPCGQRAVMWGWAPRALRGDLRSQRSVDLSVGRLTSGPWRVPCPSGPKHPRGAKKVSCFLCLQNLETGKAASLCWYGRLNAGQLLKAMHIAENAFPNITHWSIKP